MPSVASLEDPVVKQNLPASVGDMGSIPDLEDPPGLRAPKSTGQELTKLALLEPESWNYWAQAHQLRSHHKEKAVQTDNWRRGAPLSATRESPHAEIKTQRSQ